MLANILCAGKIFDTPHFVVFDKTYILRIFLDKIINNFLKTCKNRLENFDTLCIMGYE